MRLFKQAGDALAAADDSLQKVRHLSGNQLKTIAVLLMAFDHFCKIILEWFSSFVWFPQMQAGGMPSETFYQIDNFIRFRLYQVGTMAFPVFCFLAAEGFAHSRNRRRYLLRMAAFAVLSELPFDLAFFTEFARNQRTFPFYWGYQNVFFTLLLGLAALALWERFRSVSDNRKVHAKAFALQAAGVLAMAGAAELLRSDYGAEGVFLIVGFYLCRGSRAGQLLAFLVVYSLATNCQPGLPQFGVLLLLALYNGTRGKRRVKYAFYGFYPAHLLLFWGVAKCLESAIL